jgi:hypothetical protein
MALPNGIDIASFLNRTQDASFIATADESARMTYQFAKSYCRGRGFEDDNDIPNDIRAVIIGASARLATNPTVLRGEQAESYASSSGPDGTWSQQELWVLNGYRRTTA